MVLLHKYGENMDPQANTTIMNELYGVEEKRPYYASLVLDLYFRDLNTGFEHKVPQLAQKHNKSPAEIQRDVGRIEKIVGEGLGFELLEHLGLTRKIVLADGGFQVRE